MKLLNALKDARIRSVIHSRSGLSDSEDVKKR